MKCLLEAEEDIKSGFHAVARLAWGIMLDITGEDNNQTHGEPRVYNHHIVPQLIVFI